MFNVKMFFSFIGNGISIFEKKGKNKHRILTCFYTRLEDPIFPTNLLIAGKRRERFIPKTLPKSKCNLIQDLNLVLNVHFFSVLTIPSPCQLI